MYQVYTQQRVDIPGQRSIRHSFDDHTRRRCAGTRVTDRIRLKQLEFAQRFLLPELAEQLSCYPAVQFYGFRQLRFLHVLSFGVCHVN